MIVTKISSIDDYNDKGKFMLVALYGLLHEILYNMPDKNANFHECCYLYWVCKKNEIRIEYTKDKN